MKTETSATAGIERRKSIVGAVALRASGVIPRSTPIETPRMTAIAKPSTKRFRLGTRSVPKRSKIQVSLNTCTISRSGGKNDEVLFSLRYHQSATSTTGSQTSSGGGCRASCFMSAVPMAAARDASAT